MVCLGIVLQRDVSAGDLAAAAAVLNCPLLAYGKGIELGAHRDVRVDDPCEQSRDAPDEGVWMRWAPGIPEFPVALNFRHRDAGAAPFTVEELQRVLGAVCTHFGAVPAVIINRPALGGVAGPVDDDSPTDVNIFFGFDVALAVRQLTIPSTAWPEEETERLFTCWRCNQPKSVDHFHLSGYGYNADPFYDLLGNRVLGQSNKCCKTCTALLTER